MVSLPGTPNLRSPFSVVTQPAPQKSKQVNASIVKKLFCMAVMQTDSPPPSSINVGQPPLVPQSKCILSERALIALVTNAGSRPARRLQLGHSWLSDGQVCERQLVDFNRSPRIRPVLLPRYWPAQDFSTFNGGRATAGSDQ